MSRLRIIVFSELKKPSEEKIHMRISNLRTKKNETIDLEDKSGSFANLGSEDFLKEGKYKLLINYFGGHLVSLTILADKKLSKKQEKLLLLGLGIILIISLTIIIWYCRDFF